MVFKESININDWDEDKGKIIKFWESRGIKFENLKSEILIGKRGSILGNLTSFNMQKIITKITIKKLNEKQIELTIDVATIFQHITESNAEYWKLEIKTFIEYLANNKLLLDVWVDYAKRAKKSNIKWVFSIIFIVLAFEISKQVLKDFLK